MHGVFQSKGIDQWTPTGSTESPDECKQAAVTAAGNSARKFQSDRGTTVTQTGMAVEMTYASGDKASLVFVCLPDTLDPRPSKEK